MWELSKYDNRDAKKISVMSFSDFGKVFALFLGAFIVDFEYSLFIVNVIKYYLIAYL